MRFAPPVAAVPHPAAPPPDPARGWPGAPSGRPARHDWLWLFQQAVTDLVLAAGFAFALAASLAGHPRAVRPACLVTWALFSACEAAVALGYWAEADRVNAALAAAQCLPSLAFAAGIALCEASVVRVLLVYAALWASPHPAPPRPAPPPSPCFTQADSF